MAFPLRGGTPFGTGSRSSMQDAQKDSEQAGNRSDDEQGQKHGLP